MRGFTMVLFLGAAIALPISKSGFDAGEIVTSSSRSPQVLEHRAMDAIAAPLNSWSLKSIAKRVTATVLPRSPFSCCHEAAGYPSGITGGVPTYGPIVDDTPAIGEKGPANTSDDPPIQARNASFWGRADVEDTPADTEKGTTTIPDTPAIQVRSPQKPSFWGPAHVDDTPADAEKGPTTTVTPPIQARNASFWGRAHVENTPADAEEGTATTPDTPAIQARTPQKPSFWGPAHVDDTPADAEKGTATTSGTPEMHGRSPKVTPSFWGPAHVDESPSDTEDSVAA